MLLFKFLRLLDKYLPPAVVHAHGTPSLDQQSYRFRDDDDNEANATWLQAADDDISVGNDVGVDKALDTNIRIRFLIQDDGGGTSNNFQPQLEYQINGLGFNNVDGASNVVRSSTSGNFTDDDNTTQQLGAGTFITPNSGMDDDNGLAGENNNIDFADEVNDEVEVEYCFQVRSADVVDGDSIELRIQGLDTYTVTVATITVAIAAELNPSQWSSRYPDQLLPRQRVAHSLELDDPARLLDPEATTIDRWHAKYPDQLLPKEPIIIDWQILPLQELEETKHWHGQYPNQFLLQKPIVQDWQFLPLQEIEVEEVTIPIEFPVETPSIIFMDEAIPY